MYSHIQGNNVRYTKVSSSSRVSWRILGVFLRGIECDRGRGPVVRAKRAIFLEGGEWPILGGRLLPKRASRKPWHVFSIILYYKAIRLLRLVEI